MVRGHRRRDLSGAMICVCWSGAAEKIVCENDLHIAELGVATDNADARRFYERLGYRLVATRVAEWGYTTPEGDRVEVVQPEWVMQKRLA